MAPNVRVLARSLARTAPPRTPSSKKFQLDPNATPLFVADLITTVMESAYYGRSMSTSAGGGVVLVKTRRVLVLATYSDPVHAAEVR